MCGFMAAAAPASEQNRSNEVLMIYVWAFERNLQVYQVRAKKKTQKQCNVAFLVIIELRDFLN